MEKHELILIAALLELASDRFARHICNDLDGSFFADWTAEEHQKLVKDFHDWNGDPEEFNPNFLHLPDFSLMDYLADKLRGSL